MIPSVLGTSLGSGTSVPMEWLFTKVPLASVHTNWLLGGAGRGAHCADVGGRAGFVCGGQAGETLLITIGSPSKLTVNDPAWEMICSIDRMDVVGGTVTVSVLSTFAVMGLARTPRTPGVLQ